MQLTKALQRTHYGAGLLAAALSACASNPPSDTSLVEGKTQALGVVDCQNKAAQCLGTLPSPDKITSCRDEIKSCIDELQMSLPPEVQELGKCVSDAQSCAQGAKAFSDLMTCRQGFEDCIGDKVDLTNISIPDFPMLSPEVSKALDSANKCREDALSCVKAGDKSPSEIGKCAEGYRGCIVALLPAQSGSGGFQPPMLPPEVSAAIDAASKCRENALSCVKAGNGASDIAACGETFRDCIGDLLPTPSGSDGFQPPMLPPEVTAALDAANKCRDDAVSCVKAANNSADSIATCGDTFRGCIGGLLPKPSGTAGGSAPPAPPVIGLPGKGADCLEALRQCLSSEKSPQDCATEASSCIGVPSGALPTGSFPFPQPKQP